MKNNFVKVKSFEKDFSRKWFNFRKLLKMIKFEGALKLLVKIVLLSEPSPPEAAQDDMAVQSGSFSAKI